MFVRWSDICLAPTGQIINAQLPNGSQLNAQGDAQPQVIQLQADNSNAQILQTLQQQQQPEEAPQEATNTGTQVFQQVVTPGGDVMHMPVSALFYL